MNVKIRNIEWLIKEEDDCDNVYIPSTGECKIGLTKFFEKTIHIHKNLNLREKRKTLIHELTHAFLYEYGFDGVELNEEFICNFISIYANEIIDIADAYMTYRNLKEREG